MELILGTTKPRKLGLICMPYEIMATKETIKWELINGNEPVYKTLLRNGMKYGLFLFPVSYLDRLMLTFPQAHISDGLNSYLIALDAESFRILHANPPDIVPPNWTDSPDRQLYDFQRVGVEFGKHRLERDSAFLLTDDMGVGKTATSAGLVDVMNAYPCLVITTKSGKYKWGRFIRDFLPKLSYVVVDGNASKRKDQIEQDAHFTIINYESLRIHPELADIKWESIICDEFHHVKNPNAKQTIAFRELQGRYKIGLSGTPMLNGRPGELWSVLKWMYPSRFLPYDKFMEYITLTPGTYEPIAYRNLHKVKGFLNDRNLRRRKAQVLTSLPATVEKIVEVDLTDEQRKVYNEAKDNMRLWMKDGQKKTIKQVLNKSMRLKQICFSPELYGGTESSSKVEVVKEMVAKLYQTNEKVIIFSEFATATRILQRELKEYNPAYVDGSIPAKKRDEEQERFQNDENCRIYIGTIGANKEVIDLFAASYVIFVDRDWVPAYNEQAIARAWRNGQLKQVTVIILVARNTVELAFEDRLMTKNKMNTMMSEKYHVGAGNKRSNVIGIEEIEELLEAA